MPILWRPQMSVGNDLIDLEHRYLFSLVNMVDLALRSDHGREILPAALEQLVQYTREHFSREEAIQLKMGYPNYPEHHAEHQRIASALTDVGGQIERALARGPAAWDASAGERLVALLREWILNHVLSMDLRMKPYLERLPRNFSAS